MDARFPVAIAIRFALAVLALGVASSAQAQEAIESVSGSGYVEPSVAMPVSRARRAALRRLVDPGCRRLFSEFKDMEGNRLDEVLAARGDTAEGHLKRIDVLNGTDMYPCRQKNVYAFTSPGTTSVFVCGNFRKLAWENVEIAGNVLIHEMLHSLGAGEAPTPGLPTAHEISSQVKMRCGS